jgi:hypothetical protein
LLAVFLDVIVLKKEVEHPPGFEPGNDRSAGDCLTAWLWMQQKHTVFGHQKQRFLVQQNL